MLFPCVLLKAFDAKKAGYRAHCRRELRHSCLPARWAPYPFVTVLSAWRAGKTWVDEKQSRTQGA
jgi:hypothetical protein